MFAGFGGFVIILRCFSVQVIFPCPDPAALRDHRMRSLIAYAKKVEGEKFLAANSRVSYLIMYVMLWQCYRVLWYIALCYIWFLTDSVYRLHRHSWLCIIIYLPGLLCPFPATVWLTGRRQNMEIHLSELTWQGTYSRSELKILSSALPKVEVSYITTVCHMMMCVPEADIKDRDR